MKNNPDEIELRKFALSEAARSYGGVSSAGATAKVVVERAEVYYKFLNGEAQDG